MSITSEASSLGRELFGLDGKTAVVTGAARGMGKALAFGLAQFGAKVVLADVNEPEAKAAASELEAAGGHALAVEVDHTDEGAVKRLVEATESRFGPIDVLVNNAGVLSRADIFEVSLDQWDEIMNINLRGPLLCMKAVMSGMIGRGAGSVINIGSSYSSRAAVFNTSGGGADYCASKAALQALTRSAAQAAAQHGVRVNAIAPGVVDTPMHAAHREFIFEWEKYIPLGRLQVADDIVGTAVYLASDASRYVTGQTIHVNGGMLMID